MRDKYASVQAEQIRGAREAGLNLTALKPVYPLGYSTCAPRGRNQVHVANRKIKFEVFKNYLFGTGQSLMILRALKSE